MEDETKVTVQEVARHLFTMYEQNYYAGKVAGHHPMSIAKNPIWLSMAKKVMENMEHEKKTGELPHVNVIQVYDSLKQVYVMPGTLPSVEELARNPALRGKKKQLQETLDTLVYSTPS